MEDTKPTESKGTKESEKNEAKYKETLEELRKALRQFESEFKEFITSWEI